MLSTVVYFLFFCVKARNEVLKFAAFRPMGKSRILFPKEALQGLLKHHCCVRYNEFPKDADGNGRLDTGTCRRFLIFREPSESKSCEYPLRHPDTNPQRKFPALALRKLLYFAH